VNICAPLRHLAVHYLGPKGVRRVVAQGWRMATIGTTAIERAKERQSSLSQRCQITCEHKSLGTQPRSQHRLVVTDEQIVDASGRIDVLVNNAALLCVTGHER
jgi:NAD(P)-dependent dehydrogenase (short-subunit alcohol dehydrogenase family)